MTCATTSSAGVVTDASFGIADAFLALAARTPAAAALRAPGRRTATFADLATCIGDVRRQFAAWGITPGDSVLVAVSSRPAMICSSFVLPAAATCTPLPTTATAAVYAQLIDRIRPKAVVVDAGADHALAHVARNRDVTAISLAEDPDAPAGVFTLRLARASSSLVRSSSFHSDHAYVLATSGTTGRPKLVPCTHRAILLRSAAMGRWLDVTPADTGCHVSPAHLGQGLMSCIADPLLNGASLLCLPIGSVDGLLAALDEFEPTILHAGFTFHRQLLARLPEIGSRARSTRLRFLRSGSGRLEPDEATRLADTLGVPVLTGLSLTEAMSITHESLPPARRVPGSVGMPVINEVAILDADGTTISAHGSGEILVRGPTVFEGYFDDPELTAESFVRGWLRTGDLGTVDEDRFVFITGRRKEVINRGGEKVSPVAVDAVLESLPGVQEAATFGIAHPTLGEEIVAAVVTTAGAAVDASELLRQAGAVLGPTRVPRRIVFVERLPRTDTGKLRRTALAAELSDSAWVAGDGEAASLHDSRNAALETRLSELWRELLGRPALRRSDDFFLSGGDSLSGARLLARVQSTWDVAIPMSVLFGEAATIAGMAALLARSCDEPNGRRNGDRTPDGTLR